MVNINSLENEQIKILLEEEIKDFFPKEGTWTSSCFKRPNEVVKRYLPCHLRNNKWMSELLYEQLVEKGINIPKREIKNFMDESELFNELRHSYEIAIVKWQIRWIMNGGENWLIPSGFDDMSMFFTPDVDVMVRGGVVKTLRAIGMDKDVIEEGLEKNNVWRKICMEHGFRNEFEPVVYLKGSLEPANETHKQNWLAMKLYKYYQEHKESVDRYSEPTPEMLMSEEEAIELAKVLEKQNVERRRVIKEWKNKPSRKGR